MIDSHQLFLHYVFLLFSNYKIYEFKVNQTKFRILQKPR